VLISFVQLPGPLNDIDQLELVDYNRGKALESFADSPSIKPSTAHPSHTCRSEVHLYFFPDAS